MEHHHPVERRLEVVERHYQVVERQNTGGGTPFRPVPAEFNHWLQDHGYGASASRGMPVYSPAFAGTH